MQYLRKDNQQGFTLIELLIAIFGFTLIIWGLISLVSNVFFASKTQSGLLSDIDQARRLAFQITTELRSGQTGNNGSYVLDTAGNQQIIFYGNSDMDSGVERIRYFAQNGSLYKGVTEYNGTTYNTTTEKTILVQSNLANGANPVFYYYDGSYTGSSSQSPLSQPVNVTQVKFIKVAIQIYNKAGVKNTNIYTVNASATIRNLKTNLGQ
ncbi:MAG: type II secretion system protein [Candidatus Doudnabacteria bacterium]|nr:type II secretion system protein [Candidatus Doudnabacteria bacterium]